MTVISYQSCMVLHWAWLCPLCNMARKIDVTPYFLCLGTFAVLSIMVGIVCLRLAPESDFSHFNATLNATVVDTDRMNEVRLAISGTLACLTAIIQVLIPLKVQSFKVKSERNMGYSLKVAHWVWFMSVQIGLGFMQFGFVAIYLSESFVRGFMTAAGLQILISVLKYIFGITVPSYSGPLAVIYVSYPFIIKENMIGYFAKLWFAENDFFPNRLSRI